MICWGEVLSLNCMIGTQSTESKEQRGGIDKFDACPTYSTYTYGTSLISVNLSSIKYHVSCIMMMRDDFLYFVPGTVLCVQYRVPWYPGTRVLYPARYDSYFKFCCVGASKFCTGMRGRVVHHKIYIQNKNLFFVLFVVVLDDASWAIYLQSTVPGYRLYGTQKSRAISSKSYILRMTPTTPTLN